MPFRIIVSALLLAASTLAMAEEKQAGIAAPVLRDGAHDFDFEMGDWHARIQRRLRPLTGSNEWVTYEGQSTVRPVWGGKANIGELDISGSAGKLRGMSLRLYNPDTHQWSIRWANAVDGDLGAPMVGSFEGGKGYFYNQETLAGRAITVRFIFSGIDNKKTFRIEQAFSPDGGKTWETNWISDFTR